MIGLFHSRLGQPTPRGISGTVEEIERSVERGVRVHVFFSEMVLPHDIDPDQLKAVREFQAKLQERGLVGSYASHEDLSAKVRTCLEQDVVKFVPAIPPGVILPVPSLGPGAILRARRESISRQDRLVVENLGSVPAEDMTVEIEPIGEGESPVVSGVPMAAERIPPHGSIAFPLAISFEVATQWRVTYRWREGDQQFEDSQSVSIF